MSVFTINVPKSGCSYTFDTATLPQSTLDYFMQNGAKQSGADTTAQFIRKDWTGTDLEFVAAAKEQSDKWFANMKSGIVPGSRVAIDPYAVIAAQLGKTVDQVKRDLGVPTTPAEADLLVPAAPTTTLIPAKKGKAA